MNTSMEKALSKLTTEKRVLIDLVKSYEDGSYRVNQAKYIKELARVYNATFKTEGIVMSIVERYSYKELTTLHKTLLQDIIDVVYIGVEKDFATYFHIVPGQINPHLRTAVKNTFNYGETELANRPLYHNTTYDLVEIINIGGVKLALELIVAYNLVG